MDALSSALYVVLIIMTTLTIGMFIEEIYFLRTNIKSTYRRRLSVVQVQLLSLTLFYFFLIIKILQYFCVIKVSQKD